MSELNDGATIDGGRRRFVKAIPAAGFAVAIAGCSGGGGGGSSSSGGNGGGTTSGSGGGGPSGPVEVMHGWTGGDGEKAAKSLYSAWQKAHPDLKVNMNPIGGGGNQNLDAVVANRLQSNDPPGAFANWPGKNLLKYEGVLGNVDDVWQENGFEDVMVKEAVELHKLNGHFRAVPLGSHRLNCLFYNVSVVEDAGVDPKSLDSVSALIDALDTVKTQTDKTPMTQAMSGAWTTVQLWGAVMLGKNGYQSYMDFVNGKGKESDVRGAFESLKTILSKYISDDAPSLDLTASNQNIVKGNAAFIHQGNWAAGAFRNAENFKYNEDWGFVPFPGTEGMYTLHFDSFLYPANNPTPEASKVWEAFVGSTKAQIAFNKYKGSIPPRKDASMDEFGPYLQQTAKEFKNAKHRPPTLFHGLAVKAEVITQLSEVISNQFTGPYNVDAATKGFMDAVPSSS